MCTVGTANMTDKDWQSLWVQCEACLSWRKITEQEHVQCADGFSVHFLAFVLCTLEAVEMTLFVSSVVNENDVPTQVGKKKEEGRNICAVWRREAPAEGSPAEVSGFLERCLAGAEECKNTKSPNQKICKKQKMQKFIKSQHKGGKMQKSKRKIKKIEVESEKMRRIPHFSQSQTKKSIQKITQIKKQTQKTHRRRVFFKLTSDDTGDRLSRVRIIQASLVALSRSFIRIGHRQSFYEEEFKIIVGFHQLDRIMSVFKFCHMEQIIARIVWSLVHVHPW